MFFQTPKKYFAYQGEPRSYTRFLRPQESLYEAYCAFVHMLDDVTHLVLVMNSEDLVASMHDVYLRTGDQVRKVCSPGRG